ncbi:MAG: hypothetical protein EBT94_05880 [Alphaproteobacteria bacterium]|jgi:hypothetical protein|nr:hypothetical protein [Alphaproteobacteria bacterium]
MLLVASMLAFGVFASNVVIGSVTRTPFLNDVSEMLVLLTAAILFVAAILKKEAESKERQPD